MEWKTQLFQFKKYWVGVSLVAKWLRLQVPNVGGLGLIPGQGARSHTPSLKILHTTTKSAHMLNKNQRSRVLQVRPSAANNLNK